ncbi:MAG: transposase, partial [Anaerovoracaceae bacterium]
MDIILYLLNIIQEQHAKISFLLSFIFKYVPVKQWAFDDSHSPKYQKFKVDKLPTIIPFEKQDYQFLLQYYLWKYKKPLKPVAS